MTANDRATLLQHQFSFSALDPEPWGACLCGWRCPMPVLSGETTAQLERKAQAHFALHLNNYLALHRKRT